LIAAVTAVPVTPVADEPGRCAVGARLVHSIDSTSMRNATGAATSSIPVWNALSTRLGFR
jgi:hypothetical protein